MGDDLRSTSACSLAAIANAIEDLYRVFAGYRLGPHVEGCPHCVSERDHARIYSRPLRSLTADDLERYAFKAMTTWGNARDFRHFLPRILELVVSNDLDSLVPIEVVLGKLAYGKWGTWQEQEQIALRSFLRLRWSVGLTQDAAGVLRPYACQFDADSWLCGVASAGEDIAPYIQVWRQEGATKTIAHVAAFLEMNPDLIAHGRLDNPFWVSDDPQTTACAEEMRTWLTACLNDSEFQAKLAAPNSRALRRKVSPWRG